MKSWSEEEARHLKAQGIGFAQIGFAQIGSAFGVSYYTARARLDPVWLENRRRQINANRAPVRSIGKRDHVHHVIPEPAKAEEIGAGPFMTESGIMAYRKYVPNRVSLTSSPVNEGIATKAISLPFVSILSGEG